MVQEVLQKMDWSPAFLFPENEMADYVFSALDVGEGWRYPDRYGVLWQAQENKRIGGG